VERLRHGDDKGGDLISLYAAIHSMKQIDAARELAQQINFDVQTSARPSTPPRAEPAPERQGRWQPIAPVPEFAPPAAMAHYSYGEPQHSWRYEIRGRLYGYVLRFDRPQPDGSMRKEVLPLTFCRDLQDGRGSMRWTNKQWEAPRPLYLPWGDLSADSRLVPVTLVEGEKCAQAGHELLAAEFDFVTWPGGGKAWSKADWELIRGRVVYLWPDCDAKRVPLTAAEKKADIDPGTKPLLPAEKQPGVHAMAGIGALLVREYGCTVYWVPIPAPGAVPDGWDLADAIEQGWDAARVRDFIRSASILDVPECSIACGIRVDPIHGSRRGWIVAAVCRRPGGTACCSPRRAA
jgi:putative DNA primase/helicase